MGNDFDKRLAVAEQRLDFLAKFEAVFEKRFVALDKRMVRLDKQMTRFYSLFTSELGGNGTPGNVNKSISVLSRMAKENKAGIDEISDYLHKNGLSSEIERNTSLRKKMESDDVIENAHLNTAFRERTSKAVTAILVTVIASAILSVGSIWVNANKSNTADLQKVVIELKKAVENIKTE